MWGLLSAAGTLLAEPAGTALMQGDVLGNEP